MKNLKKIYKDLVRELNKNDENILNSMVFFESEALFELIEESNIDQKYKFHDLIKDTCNKYKNIHDEMKKESLGSEDHFNKCIDLYNIIVSFVTISFKLMGTDSSVLESKETENKFKQNYIIDMVDKIQAEFPSIRNPYVISELSYELFINSFHTKA